jgi:hypothetical protein
MNALLILLIAGEIALWALACYAGRAFELEHPARHGRRRGGGGQHS